MRHVVLVVTFFVSVAVGATCESVGGQLVSDGTFTPPAGPAIKDLPAFCRVSGALHPTADSNIQYEIWMPASGWNGKFHGVGNGGFAGSLSYNGLGGPVRHGYAAATTDTGHSGTDAAFAPGHPEKVIDYGYRGIHLMTEKAKEVITAFYGSAPKHSYFVSCSNGGRQALMEAQRFPGDYDGIIAGAPANNFTHIGVGFVENLQALLKGPESYIPASKLKAIEAWALAACDARDGLTDGLIDDPTRCRFDTATLLCQAAESDSCLTAPQVASLKTIYDGPKNAKGASIYPGFVPGGEDGQGGWSPWIIANPPEKSLQYFFGTGMFQNMVFENPAWDFKSFDPAKDLKRIDEKLAKILNATDTNLKPFEARGGKLILYHGWCDAALTPLNTIQYYKDVVAKAGSKKAAGFVRLYMLPGVQHCSGGPGPSRFVFTWTDPEHDMALALERWVETGNAPGAIVAGKVGEQERVIRTRPLCPYPQVAVYKGSGSVDEAGNFSCSVR